jgi:dUTPase
MGGLHSGTVRVILGRKSLTSQGFIVPPGIIDEDFKGEIEVMAYVNREMLANTGGRAAQLLVSLYQGKAAQR